MLPENKKIAPQPIGLHYKKFMQCSGYLEAKNVIAHLDRETSALVSKAFPEQLDVKNKMDGSGELAIDKLLLLVNMYNPTQRKEVELSASTKCTTRSIRYRSSIIASAGNDKSVKDELMLLIEQFKKIQSYIDSMLVRTTEDAHNILGFPVASST